MSRYKIKKNILMSVTTSTAKMTVAAVSAVLVLIILSVIFLGSSFGGLGSALTTLGINVQERLDVFSNHTISNALDGLILIERVYTLNDSDVVAPEPNQEAFGSTDDPASLQWFIDDVTQRLNGEELFFKNDSPLFQDSKATYYLDDTIASVTWKQTFHRAVYTFSEIKIEHPSQFRRFLADGKYGSDKQYLTSQMASSVNAVVASAGDFYKYRPWGLVVYNNKVERFKGTYLDSCFIDDKGDLLFVDAKDIQTEEELREYVVDNNVRFSLSFGPILIEDGKSKIPNSYLIGEITGNFSRSAICQLGDLHYLLVTVNDEPGYRKFPTLFKFADTLISQGITHAYTLDGGQTATIVMNDEVINQVSYGAERYISDIIYFATAIPNKK